MPLNVSLIWVIVPEIFCRVADKMADLRVYLAVFCAIFLLFRHILCLV